MMRAMAADRDQLRADARRASVVILVAMVAWLSLSALGGALGLPPQLALLLDAACLVALGWAIWRLACVWRASRGDQA
jgi:hypothetical protein